MIISSKKRKIKLIMFSVLKSFDPFNAKEKTLKNQISGAKINKVFNINPRIVKP